MDKKSRPPLGMLGRGGGRKVRVDSSRDKLSSSLGIVLLQ